MDAFLERADPRLAGPDLADDAGPHAGAGHALGELADQLIGKVVGRATVDERLGRVVGLVVPAAAHHDLQAGAACQAAQPLRIAADARHGEVHQRRATSPPEVAQLVGQGKLVGTELPVVPSVPDVPQVDAGVLVREREAHAVGRDGAAHGQHSRSHGMPPLFCWASAGEAGRRGRSEMDPASVPSRRVVARWGLAAGGAIR
jgi:hypothetical protein